MTTDLRVSEPDESFDGQDSEADVDKTDSSVLEVETGADAGAGRGDGSEAEDDDDEDKENKSHSGNVEEFFASFPASPIPTAVAGPSGIQKKISEWSSSHLSPPRSGWILGLEAL